MSTRLSFRSFAKASKTTRVLGMGLLLLSIGGAFAACSFMTSDDDSSSDPYSDSERGNRLPYLTKECPGSGCM